MIKKKLISGILALAMVVSSAAGISVKTVYAEDQQTGMTAEADVVGMKDGIHVEKKSYDMISTDSIDVASDGSQDEVIGYSEMETYASRIAIDGKNFPDANFRQYLINNIGSTYVDPSSVYYIDCSGYNISSLQGIEYFTELLWLECMDNNISQLDVSKNTKLACLDCSNNRITQLTIGNNSNMLYLYCENNNLSTLDISGLTQLDDMYCFNNQMTQLDISNNIILNRLRCDVWVIRSLDLTKSLDLIVYWDSLDGQYVFGMCMYGGERLVGCFYYIGQDMTYVSNDFKTDGVYTYYLQYDGSAMIDRLTYHPDGVHIIYFDEYGHEVFSDFAHVMKSIAGDAVDDYCFFDVYGYMYVNVLTYDKTGTQLLYANPYGQLEHTGWFAFGVEGKDGLGYANPDATLMTSQYTYDWNGNLVYIEADGHVRGSGDVSHLWPVY